MSEHWSGERPRYGKTIKVDNGLKAKSKRGDIGATWWSRRFIDVLESLGFVLWIRRIPHLGEEEDFLNHVGPPVQDDVLPPCERLPLCGKSHWMSRCATIACARGDGQLFTRQAPRKFR